VRKWTRAKNREEALFAFLHLFLPYYTDSENRN